MASNINPTNIDTTYPIAGQDNDTQGFRTNFTTIYNNFLTAASEITALQSTVTNAPSITSVPISPSAAGTPGQVAYDSVGHFYYICYATNQWATLPTTSALAGSYVDATGTGNAIIADYVPAITTLYDGLVMYLGANAVNTTSNVTLQVNAFSPLPIRKGTNQELLPGDIGGAHHQMIIMYNSGTNAFTLLNPISARPLANLSTAQISNISTPVTGQMVFNNTSGNVQIYTGAVWGNITIS